MRRVVITGMGIVSSIGNNTQEVLASLHEAKSGITRAEKYAELGFRSQVQGAPTLNPADVIDRRAMRFLGEGAAWNHIAMEQAIRDSGLEPAEVSNVRTGIIMGSGGPSARTIVEAVDDIAFGTANGPTRFGPLERVTSAASTMVRADGPPEPMMMPVRTSETSDGCRPESWIACSIAM